MAPLLSVMLPSWNSRLPTDDPVSAATTPAVTAPLSRLTAYDVAEPPFAARYEIVAPLSDRPAAVADASCVSSPAGARMDDMATERGRWVCGFLRVGWVWWCFSVR